MVRNWQDFDVKATPSFYVINYPLCKISRTSIKAPFNHQLIHEIVLIDTFRCDTSSNHGRVWIGESCSRPLQNCY